MLFIIHYPLTLTPYSLLLFLPRGSEWIIIALVILLLFGGRKIPELMRGLGRGIRSFRDGMNEVKNDLNEDEKEEKEGKEGK